MQRAVLAAVGIAGVLAVTMIAPNILQALPLVAGKAKFRYRAKSAVGRLAEKGLVRFVEREGMRYAKITEKGRRSLNLELAKAAVAAQHRKRWDKRYRLVMFDIPHYRKNDRDRLRRIMQDIGFLHLQHSVWIYPHDCEELIALLKADLKFGKAVIYAVVESIENDGWIKRHFNLR